MTTNHARYPVRLASTILALCAVLAPSSAHASNISGRWTDPTGRVWWIADAADAIAFKTSVRSRSTGTINLAFTGKIRHGSNGNAFRFRGEAFERKIQLNGQTCRMSGSMNAAGDIAGDWGGRVIHMDSCQAQVTVICGGEDLSVPLACSGLWE
jgi:hypothetical protein